MSRLYTFPCGHQWEGPADDPDLDTNASLACPICNASFANPPPPRQALTAAKEFQQIIRDRADDATSERGVEAPSSTSLNERREQDQSSIKEWPTIAGYEVLAILGRGGMGLVYKARHIELKRLVALKVILAGEHADPQELARFRGEAEAVARLEHPNIVQIYEVGEHQGRPFFSLEFVEGGNLAQKLAGTPLLPRQAAQLVEILALAIHYAHQRGIVHRDLKPGNILLKQLGKESDSTLEEEQRHASRPSVSLSGNSYQPKITDFGLAKRLDDEDTGQTRTGVIMGTPSYMAPEQAEGRSRDAGPAVDVYALGAILYETVTGRPPFKAASTLGTLEQVRAQDPVPPRRLQLHLPKDLETICLKCLNKQPHRRYASAFALAEDLHRFLAGAPIQARPAGVWERTLKWARRRPAAAALIVVSIAAVVSLLAGALWYNAKLRAALQTAEDRRQEAMVERSRAEENFQKARNAVDEMLTEVGEQKLARVPQMEPVRRALLEKALKFYQAFLEEKSDDQAVMRETARAYGRAAAIHQMLGQHAKAEGMLKQGLILQDQLVERFPDVALYRADQASSHNALGNVYRLSSRAPQAEAAHKRALEIREQIAREDPSNLESQSDVAKSYLNLAVIYAVTRRMEDAERGFKKALEIHEQLATQRPDDAHYREELAKAHTNLGSLYYMTRQADKAEESYKKSLPQFESLVKQHPDVPSYQNEFAASYNNLGELYNSIGRHADSASAQQKAIEVRERLTRDFPKLLDYAVDLGGSYCNMGDAVRDDGRPAEAIAWFDKAVKTLESVLGEAKEHAVAKEYLGNSLRGRAEAQQRQTHYAEALRDLDRVRDLVTGPDRDSVGLTRAVCLARLGDYVQAIKAAENLEKNTKVSGDTLLGLARVYSVTSSVVPNDLKLSVAERDRLTNKYAGHAVELLGKAATAGEFKKPTSAAELQKEDDFAPLGSRADFQEFLRALNSGK
jgi:serine/threonine protein kinase